MRNIIKSFILLCGGALLAVGCNSEVKDEAVNPYSFSAVAETVREGNDIPVHLRFSDAGLTPDNAGWGDKWEKATFYGELYDGMGRTVDNAVFSGPGGILSNGTVFDIPSGGRFDIVIASLREGEYRLRLNIKTRYTVDTWATAVVNVLEKDDDTSVTPPGDGDDTILVDDISVPGAGSGLDIDEIGNVVLDLKYFNESNPYRYRCVVRPDDATNKQLVASTGDELVALARIEGQTLLELTPMAVGRCTITVLSADGNARRSFGLTVIHSPDEADGFTLPTDDDQKDAYGFDVAGRLELDIDEWNDTNVFSYECQPIPATAASLLLVASSDNESVLEARIDDGHFLKLTPRKPGYATVTVSTTDGTIVRTMRVVVFSNVNLVVDVREGTASEEDKTSGAFPCELTFKTDARWLPTMMQVEVYGKATGRIDLTDPVDYFKADSLKNSRTAYFSFQEKVPVLYLSNGNSAYNVYTRLMKKVASMGAVVHHSADWPNNKDYIAYYRLYKITLNLNLLDNFDTNVYRVTLDERYNLPTNKIYHYLF